MVAWISARQYYTSNVDKKIDKLDTRIDKLDTRIDKLDTRMDKLDTGIQDIYKLLLTQSLSSQQQ